MASLALESFGDLVEATIKRYVKKDYVQLLTDLTDHPAAKSLIKKTRMATQGGVEFEWKVAMNTGDSYAQIDATTPDEVAIYDALEAAKVPFRKRETKYAFLEEEVDFNMGEEQIIDVVKTKERGCDVDWIEGFENEIWDSISASNSRALYSIPYWITKNATVGFNGAALSGFTTVGNLSPTTWSRWKNYSGNYTDVTLADLISKMRTMAEDTDFKPPVNNANSLGSSGAPAYYTTLSVWKTFADVADSRNDNLGPDVAKHDGLVTFRGALVNRVPWLDRDTTNPIYQIVWDTFKLVYQTNWWQKRTMIKKYPGKRNQCAVFYDTWMNLACFNRRRNAVLATGTTYP